MSDDKGTMKMKKAYIILGAVLSVGIAINIYLFSVNSALASDMAGIDAEIQAIESAIADKAGEISVLSGERSRVRIEYDAREKEAIEQTEAIEAGRLSLTDGAGTVAILEGGITDKEKRLEQISTQMDELEAQVVELEARRAQLSRPRNDSGGSGDGGNSGQSADGGSSDADDGGQSTDGGNQSANDRAAEAEVSVAALAEEVVRLVNIERQNNGLSPFSSGDATLNAAAMTRAEELHSLFSHSRPDGRQPWTAYWDLGGESGRAMGENIASGHRTPEAVVSGWMNSPGHRANILNANFSTIGVGVARNEYGGLAWVQLFMG